MKTAQKDLIMLQAMPTGGGSDITLKKNIRPFTHYATTFEQEDSLFPLLVNLTKQQFARTQKNKARLNKLRVDIQKMQHQLAHL